jgi:hypothetical protein
MRFKPVLQQIHPWMKRNKKRNKMCTDADVLPVLDHVFPHGFHQVAVFLGVCEVLLVVSGL